MAVLLAGGRYRETRRRRSLNERLHELRRPLQTLALAAPAREGGGPDPLELALAALRDLDREVNGVRTDSARRPVDARLLLVAARERWMIRAAAAGRELNVRWRCGEAFAHADPVRVAQALDNLIANAIEHGGGAITLEGHVNAGRVDLVVRDTGQRRPVRLREHRDPRRGHGLRLVSRLARGSGGRLELRRSAGSGTVAALVLPLARPRPRTTMYPHRA
jgi:signal transduction histidine kinase